ncbi:response regulator [Alkalibaculum sp. M08DMB]|uniref:Stage 0 sporulation protein A homolog n=1 Tax=Alkalibaculum sporogenes TaxID=2655001 RepID=A0A6A7K685_9FIRM|nr:response regulator transcription factor [Alkalibaculum sporogenes]MPW24936.1 response regulator [Alkalibaculum sporogenes]
MKNDIIKILLIDDHSVVRLGIRSLIEKNSDMMVCGEYGTLTAAYENIKGLEPDVVLLDIKLPDGDGVTGCMTIKTMCPQTKVIILTAYGEDSLIVDVIKAGADGYLLKNIDSKTIISSIRGVTKGDSILDPNVISKVLGLLKNKDTDDVNLTQQEQEILNLISEGKTNKKISKEMFITEKTVRNYVSIILKKINVSNRTEAALYWIRQKSLK